MAQVAVAWSMSKPFITAPIVGTTSLDKLEDLVGEYHIDRHKSRSGADRTHFCGHRSR